MSSSSDVECALQTALEDFLTRVDGGETPDPGEYLAQYPQCATGLREFFSDWNFVNRKIAEAKASTDAGFDTEAAACARPPATAANDKGFAESRLPQIKGFKILEELGGGSQGIVYKAEQNGTKRVVALKVIREGAFASKGERRRFESEVELASRLGHSNIVSIYAYGRDSGHDYFAMEFIEGETLDTYVAVRTLELRALLELFEQICDAVSFAHQRGVIHRDLKPSNVIVDSSGQPHIVDFGLAKAIPDTPSVIAAGVTQPGEFAGTWDYASPEQVKRDPALVDVRSDVYALGVILYELLTDASPYPTQGESRETIARHILETPPMRPSFIRRDIDNEVETIILYALRKDPNRRYQSVAVLRDEIRRYLAGEAIEAKRDSSWYVLRKTIQRYRWRVAAVATALTALLVFAVTVSVLYSKAMAARATTEIRAQVVRNSQAYLANKLDELTWASNRLGEIAEAHPDLPEVQLLGKHVYKEPLRLFGTVVADMPERIYEAIRSPSETGYDEALRWLNAHEHELAEIEELSRTERFHFGVKRSGDAGLAFYDRPEAMGEAARVCEALAARARFQYGNVAHGLACASLEAARSIALDLGDGRLPLHTALSIGIRSQTYDVLLTILNEVGSDGAVANAYVNWVLRDPPLARYRLAMTAERQRLSQLCEGAAFANGSGRSGRVDLDVLNRLADGFYGKIGQLTDEDRVFARSLTPDETLAVIDTFIREAERWDSLPLRELDECASQLFSELHSNRPWRIVRPLVSQYKSAFQSRRRIVAKRAAMLLAAHLCRYHADHGHWPATLDAALPEDARVNTLDPYIGRAFGYRLLDDRPILYSINEDARDDEGKHGDWGDPQTDVVLFGLRVE